MFPADRMVTVLPLRELFDETGPVEATRGSDLSAVDIRERLGDPLLRFVIASVGAKLRWYAKPEVFAIWRDEVRPRLAYPEARVSLDEYPGGYCYRASEWTLSDGTTVVVLECHH
jgi:hypothetical protein